MRKIECVWPLALLAVGCGTQPDPQETEAVRDYIASAELEKVDRIRTGRHMSHRYVSDYFVIVEGLREEYLVEFSRRCHDLTRTDFTPEMMDERRDTNHLEPKFDTIRGCRIGSIYGLSGEQSKEIRNLGDAPGDEVFIPEESE